MDKKLLVSLSTEPAKNVEQLIDYVKQVENYTDFFHCDVMDGKFVERVLLSKEIISILNKNTKVPLDVHLMTVDLKDEFLDFVKAGANYLTIHYEIFENENLLIETLKKIKSAGAKVGVSIKPKTSEQVLINLLPYIDLVLIMSVEPGLGGQKFMESAYEKVAKTKELIKNFGKQILISVDGGVVPEIAQNLKKYGADMVVSGSYVYKSQNKFEAINSLK